MSLVYHSMIENQSVGVERIMAPIGLNLESGSPSLPAAAVGSMAYMVSATGSLFVADGQQWNRISATGPTTIAWLTSGNAGTSSATNYCGTTDSQPMNISSGGSLSTGPGTTRFKSNGQIETLSPLQQVLIGQAAGPSVSGAGQTLLGYHAGTSITSGTDSTLIGRVCGVSATTQIKNTGLGSSALQLNTGNRCTAVGFAALGNNTADENCAFGNVALQQCTSGARQVAVGHQALNALTTAQNCSAVGYNALALNVTGTGCCAMGTFAGAANTTSYTTAFGTQALQSCTTGADSCAFGPLALRSVTTGDSNSAFGSRALELCTSVNNCAFGAGAGAVISTGFNNNAFGSRALTSLTTAYGNNGFGASALRVCTSGTGNTALGDNVFNFITTGQLNCGLGKDSGLACITGTESNNILIMNQGVNGESAAIRIGSAAQTKNVQAGIAGVTVANSAAVLIDATTGQLGTVASSERFKEQVADLGDKSSPILKLRPVSFVFKEHPEMGEQMGFIAEEVEKVMPQFVLKKKVQRVIEEQELIVPEIVEEVEKVEEVEEEQHELRESRAIEAEYEEKEEEVVEVQPAEPQYRTVEKIIEEDEIQSVQYHFLIVPVINELIKLRADMDKLMAEDKPLASRRSKK